MSSEEVQQEKVESTIVAFGGNALCPDPSQDDTATQRENAEEAVASLRSLLEGDGHIYVVHGNGPQVGQELLRQEEASTKIPEMPLDSCVANTQGSIGYLLEQAFRNLMIRKDMNRKVVTLLTQVVVDPRDPAFGNPTKPVGPFYTPYRARQLTQERGWVMKEDSGRGYRLVVPSPEPLKIHGVDAAQRLAAAGYVVITCGGGGIPVATDPMGGSEGLAAVIDKDFSAALLGKKIQAERLILVTGVPNVMIHFGTKQEKNIEEIPVEELIALDKAGHFPAGSMGPKVRAAIQFIMSGGKEAIITSPSCIADALVGKSGTRVSNPNEYCGSEKDPQQSFTW